MQYVLCRCHYVLMQLCNEFTAKASESKYLLTSSWKWLLDILLLLNCCYQFQRTKQQCIGRERQENLIYRGQRNLKAQSILCWQFQLTYVFLRFFPSFKQTLYTKRDNSKVSTARGLLFSLSFYPEVTIFLLFLKQLTSLNAYSFISLQWLARNR